MKLPESARTPLWIRLVSLLGALVAGILLTRLILTFGWYASGLAAHKEEERRRREQPIELRFADPNAGRGADPNGDQAPDAGTQPAPPPPG
ncbi:MAG TPA: hypothetical protein VJV23_15130 [Candidatus Polarisedimenticolia bacterium]|nr:hypothetical protein [Candidatus Polarisedimenticolia bacterium]